MENNKDPMRQIELNEQLEKYNSFRTKLNTARLVLLIFAGLLLLSVYLLGQRNRSVMAPYMGGSQSGR